MVGVSGGVLALSLLATGAVGRRSREGIRQLLEETGSVRTIEGEPTPEPARG
jgi:hypothetical protein